MLNNLLRKSRIAFAGNGAVGLFYGIKLAEVGLNVHFCSDPILKRLAIKEFDPKKESSK
jgi:hypothetical protein